MAGTIRLATEADADAIQAIYAPFVQDTVISFEVEPPTPEDMRQRIRKTLVSHPWLVYQVTQDEIAGYAYASRHRERAAYQWAVDVTVYVRPDFQRSGIGRGLYTSLFAILRLQGFYTAFAGITLPNPASVGLHQALGFQYIGVYPNVGYKLGRWHEVSWWGLLLQPVPDSPQAPSMLPDVFDHPDWQMALNSGLAFIPHI